MEPLVVESKATKQPVENIADLRNSPHQGEFVIHPGSVATRIKDRKHKDSLDRILLESQKWAGYQVSLSTLESKVASLEAEKVKLMAAKASLRQELMNAKLFKAKVFKEVSNMKEPFDITKVKGYRPSYKQEHTKAGNELATSTFLYLFDVVKDPYAFVETSLQEASDIVEFGSDKDPGYSCSYFSYQARISSSNSMKSICVLFSLGLISINPTPEPSKLEAPSIDTSPFSLLTSNTTLMLFVVAASALRKGSDFSAPFDRKWLSAASFPLRLCMSLSVLGGLSTVTALTFKGLALIPCLVIRCPKMDLL
nr:hypothetical protein [Tanacetum cinerariifolium]